MVSVLPIRHPAVPNSIKESKKRARARRLLFATTLWRKGQMDDGSYSIRALGVDDVRRAIVIANVESASQPPQRVVPTDCIPRDSIAS